MRSVRVGSLHSSVAAGTISISLRLYLLRCLNWQFCLLHARGMSYVTPVDIEYIMYISKPRVRLLYVDNFLNNKYSMYSQLIVRT
jgi:hypothetical protein